MLILAGLTMAVSIIVLASITSNLASLSTPSDAAGFSLDSEHIEIRKKFGMALKECMDDDFQNNINNNNWVKTKFDYTADTFTFIEMKHNFYFAAVYIGVNTAENGVVALLTLADGDECIQEEVDYYIQ